MKFSTFGRAVAVVAAFVCATILVVHARAALADAANLGARVGARLLDEGASEILDEVRKQSS